MTYGFTSRLPLVLGLIAIFATATFAHQGVKNPAVLARMDNMKVIADHTKVLGQMAKGATPFDAAKARAAATELAKAAGEVVPLFKAPEKDLKSEALPAIWTAFPDFTMRAEALENAATKAASAINDPATLADALKTIGGTCSDCHRTYRID